MDAPPAFAAWRGSPGSLVAFSVDPVHVPVVPPIPAAAANASFAGRVTTVQPRVAGVGSALPAASTARTANEWTPSGTEDVAGEEHADHAPPSSEHWKPPGSVPVKPKLAEWDVVVPTGPDVIDVSGGVVSTAVQVNVAGVGSTFPTASVARAENVWEPAASAV